MGIRQFKPVTASSRFRSVSDFDTITRSTPEKSLTEPLTKSGGRDNHGHISMRRRGGGHKRKYRLIKARDWFETRVLPNHPRVAFDAFLGGLRARCWEYLKRNKP